MLFQIDNSAWTVIYILGILAVVIAAVVLTALVKGTLSHTIVAVGLLVSLLMSCGGIFLAVQNRVENDARFSQQLMDEYHVTSNRSLSAMQFDFNRYRGSDVVFTQDGRDTPVFVKLVSRDDNQVTMVFNVIDGSSVFPKPNK
jgi:hypothetical protein